MVQGGVPPAGAGDPDGLANGLGRPDEHNKLFRAGDGGVEQVRCSIIHELVVIGDDHARILAALGAVHRDR